MPARPKDGLVAIVDIETMDDLVARLIEVAAQIQKPIPSVTVVDMRVHGGVTDRAIHLLGGIRAAKSLALQAVGEVAHKQVTPKAAANKAAKKRPPPKRPKWKRGESRKIEGWRKVFAMGDVHAGEHHPGALGAALACMKHEQPDVVILGGDMGEFESVSTYANGGLNAFEDDVAVVGWMLDKIRDAAGDALIVYLEGNHEDRLPRWLKNNAPNLIGTIDMPTKLRLKERGIEWVPADPKSGDPVYRMGGLMAIHGHQDMQGWGSKYHANKMADTHGDPGKTLIYFHTHKHQVMDRPHSRGVCRAIGLGCLRDLRPSWKSGKTDGWIHQWAIAHVSETSARVEPVTYADGVALYGGRAYR